MWPALQSFRLRDAIDILLVAVVFYRVFVMFKETRAVQMLLGLGALMAASFLANRFELYGTSWILDNFWSFWVLALIVLFQPELRRTLAHFGQSSFFQVVTRAGREQQSHLLDEVAKAAESLAGKRIGALVVLERTTGLRNYVELGVAGRMETLHDVEALHQRLAELLSLGAPPGPAEQPWWVPARGWLRK